jgi:GR25 family glycosyltransferase involved in LPS biosynthesis
MNFPAYVIHLDSAKERLPIIENLEKDLKIPITIVSASDGSELWGSKELKHPWIFNTLTKGMVGCGLSHYNILSKVVEEGVLVLEDDAKVNCAHEEINTLLNDIREISKDDWDILLLGANEYIEHDRVNDAIHRVYKFWGTHALIVRKRCIPYILNSFDESLSRGVCLYGDWLYNHAIKKNKLKVYGPSSPKYYISQSEGYVSALTGKVRK